MFVVHYHAVNTSIADKIHGLFPNPVNHYIFIEGLPQTKLAYFNVTFINRQQSNLYYSIFFEDTLLELGDLNTGTYIMTISNNDFHTTQKITVSEDNPSQVVNLRFLVIKKRYIAASHQTIVNEINNFFTIL
ncbi:MAG: hypothetical protein IPF58_18055 [Saprospirales bacterium]|nr:hypothetical protein [Saprospirales bacterium]